MDFAAIASAIMAGQLDDRLGAIVDVVKERRDAQARVKFYSLTPGDKVRFVATVRPRYLAGATGTLRALRNTRVTVDLDKPAGRFHRGIVTPVGLVEKIGG